MKKIGIFKKNFFLFFLILFSIFTIFSTASFSKRSGFFFLDQEKVIEEEIDSEIWPLSNNLIILLFFLIIIFIIYTLCIIFPISKKEDKFFFERVQRRGLEKRVSLLLSKELLERMDIEEIPEIPEIPEIGLETAPEVVNSEEIVNHKKKAMNAFDFCESDMSLIEAIIEEYGKKDYEKDYGKANLTLTLDMQKYQLKENVSKEDKKELSIREYNDENYGGQKKEENFLYADIMGFGITKEDAKVGQIMLEVSEEQRLKNKYNFFNGIMLLARRKMKKEFANNVKKEGNLKNGDFLSYDKVYEKVFSNPLKSIIKKLLYIPVSRFKSAPGKDKRHDALQDFTDFFSVILYHLFCSEYENKFKTEAPSFNLSENGCKEFDAHFAIVSGVQGGKVKKKLKMFNKKAVALTINMGNIVKKYNYFKSLKEKEDEKK